MISPMKTKSFVILILITITSTLIFLINNRNSSLHAIVRETHKHISNLKNLHVGVKKELVTDTKYLQALGFMQHDQTQASYSNGNYSLPIIVTSIATGELDQALAFVKSAKHILSELPLVLYDLGLSNSEILVLNRHCNSSLCAIKKFNFEDYPPHVSDQKIFAYRPLIIQEALNEAGSIIWLDCSYRITSKLQDYITHQAQQSGLISWSINQPTSALTHPKMFDYFHTRLENFYFHRMVEPSHVIIYNTEKIHKQLMLPWIQCALTVDCIAPVGSQSTGCRFDKKPLYRYSGCHRYDASAFNIILGIVFNYNVEPYTAHVNDKFFQALNDDDWPENIPEQINDTEFPSKLAKTSD